jgi:membrane-bound serine protease (ClpP class)
VAEVAGERIDVVTEGEYIQSGAAVEVVRAEGYRHVVRAAREQAAAPPART